VVLIVASMQMQPVSAALGKIGNVKSEGLTMLTETSMRVSLDNAKARGSLEGAAVADFLIKHDMLEDDPSITEVKKKEKKLGHFLLFDVERPVEDVTLKINGQAIVWMLVLFAGILVGGAIYLLKPMSGASFPTKLSADGPRKGPVDAWAYVGCSPPHVYGVCEPGRTDVLLPSGVWRGYSREEGKDFEVVEFALDFTSGGENQPGQVTGSGTDDTGKYSLAGVFEQRRIAFQKKYIWGTPALDGRVNHEGNTGHVVEFRAEWAGENLRKGIKGTWYIEELSGTPRSSGNFHVWPAMDGWQRIGQKVMAPTEPDNVRGFGAEETPRKILAFKVEKDQICAKCYENPINVCLLPCGHTAICQSCESKLRHRLCPICYACVNMIVTENGTVLKSRQTTSGLKNPSTAPSTL